MEVIEDKDYERARKRVDDLKGFYVHLFTYIGVNLFLFLLNILTAPGNWWFYWPLLGWGIGLAAHAASVFVWNPFLGQEWEERKIREIMEREKNRRG
jgi:hypothetical protein